MIIVRLLGGLGNQMFQYALGRHLAEIHKTNLKLDISSFPDLGRFPDGTLRAYSLNMFNIRENFATKREVAIYKRFEFMPKSQELYKILIRLFKKQIISEPSRYFYKEVFEIKGDLYLVGYWQSFRYFIDIEEIIKNEFTINFTLNDSDNDIAKLIQTTNSICLHIRRGDYVNNPIINQYHGVCSTDYYTQAIEMVKRNTENPYFFVFSDDINWCERNLQISAPHVFVKTKNVDFSTQTDFKLMTSCKHFIISNSTLGWWAAWLSQSPSKIIISPKQWIQDRSFHTQDLIPENWITI